MPAGDRVFITYEAVTTSGKRFRNTEILTLRDGKITEAEVYFGWNIPTTPRQAVSSTKLSRSYACPPSEPKDTQLSRLTA